MAKRIDLYRSLNQLSDVLYQAARATNQCMQILRPDTDKRTRKEDFTTLLGKLNAVVEMEKKLRRHITKEAAGVKSD